jgi:hypothetical protein
MNSVTQFAQYLLRLDPQKTLPRQSLFNYCKHILEPTEPFSPETIEGFYSRALNFEYWQNNSQSLAQSVREDLASFLKQTKIDENEWKHIRHADEIQVVNLQHQADFEAVITNVESSRQKSGEKLKIVKLSEQEIASLMLSNAGTLEVRVFGTKVKVVGSQLQPLAPIAHLHYAHNLELIPHVRQLLQGSLASTISFYRDENGLNGIITRSHTMQKFETFMRVRGSENVDLFYGLKRIERNFINPQSDPYYQEIVQAMERAARALQTSNGQNSAVQMAEKALQKGGLALKSAFPNDRLLQLLVTHLDHGIRQARTQQANTRTEGAESARSIE